MISSVHQGVLPASLGGAVRDGVVDWLPIDGLADVLVELTLLPRNSSRLPLVVDEGEDVRGDGNEGGDGEVGGAMVFHPASPSQTARWDELRGGILTAVGKTSGLATARHLKVVSFREWLDRVYAAIKDNDHQSAVTKNPTIKLLEFYESLLAKDGRVTRFSYERTVRASLVLRGSVAVMVEWMER